MTYSGFLSQEQRVALDEGERLDGARPGAVGLRCHAGERGGSGKSVPDSRGLRSGSEGRVSAADPPVVTLGVVLAAAGNGRGVLEGLERGGRGR